MSSQLKGMWKEVVVAGFEILLCHFPGGAEETHKKLRVVGVPAEIRTCL